jgi:hypothetical protein
MGFSPVVIFVNVIFVKVIVGKIILGDPASATTMSGDSGCAGARRYGGGGGQLLLRGMYPMTANYSRCLAAPRVDIVTMALSAPGPERG